MLSLNIIHWNYYRFEKWTQSIISYPVYWATTKINKDKRKDCDKITRMLNNPTVGLSSILAQCHFYALFFFFIYGTSNYISGLLGFFLGKNPYVILILLLVSEIPPYLISFKNDKYLCFFKKYEKMPKEKKRKSVYLSIVIELLMLGYIVGSFAFMSYRFHS